MEYQDVELPPVLELLVSGGVVTAGAVFETAEDMAAVASAVGEDVMVEAVTKVLPDTPPEAPPEAAPDAPDEPPMICDFEMNQ